MREQLRPSLQNEISTNSARLFFEWATMKTPILRQAYNHAQGLLENYVRNQYLDHVGEPLVRPDTLHTRVKKLFTGSTTSAASTDAPLTTLLDDHLKASLLFRTAVAGQLSSTRDEKNWMTVWKMVTEDKLYGHLGIQHYPLTVEKTDGELVRAAVECAVLVGSADINSELDKLVGELNDEKFQDLVDVKYRVNRGIIGFLDDLSALKDFERKAEPKRAFTFTIDPNEKLELQTPSVSRFEDYRISMINNLFDNKADEEIIFNNTPLQHEDNPYSYEFNVKLYPRDLSQVTMWAIGLLGLNEDNELDKLFGSGGDQNPPTTPTETPGPTATPEPPPPTEIK